MEDKTKLKALKGKKSWGVTVLPMARGLVVLERRGGMLGEGGRQRWTPTLHSMSSSIFLLGPFDVNANTNTSQHVRHAITCHKQDKEKRGFKIHRHSVEREREWEKEREQADSNHCAFSKIVDNSKLSLEPLLPQSIKLTPAYQWDVIR